MDDLGEGNCDLLDFDQEDDNLLGISPTELCLGVSPSSLSTSPCIMKLKSMEDLENHFGEGRMAGASGTERADSRLTLATLPSRSHVISNSVLSVLNFNEMDQRKSEEPWSKKGIGFKESMQIDGICETSPVQNSGNLTSQHSRSYLDIETKQDEGTSEKAEGETTLPQKSRSRLSTTVQKSLAWDKAFFTDEGVLDNDELFAAFATNSDGSPNSIASYESTITPIKIQRRPGAGSEAENEVRHDLRPGVDLEVRPQNLRIEPRPNSRRVAHTQPRQDLLHSTSVRPVRQILSGAQPFSSAHTRAAVTPSWTPSIPLSTNFSKLGKQLGDNCSPTSVHTHATHSHMKELPNTCIAREARPAALKMFHEVPSQREPWSRLPTTRKVQNKPSDEIHKMKQRNKAELNPLMEIQKKKQQKVTHAIKQVKKLEGKPVVESQKLRQPLQNRSMSTSNLPDSPSTPCRKVSSLFKEMTETEEKVAAVKAPTILQEPFVSDVERVENTLILLSMPKVKASYRTRSKAAAAPFGNCEEVFAVKDMLKSKPPTSSKDSSPQVSSLMRTKSAFAVPGQSRASDMGNSRGFIPSAPSPKVQPSEPVGKPAGSSEPPKLGLFDMGRTSSAQQKAAVASKLFQDIQYVGSGIEVSTSIPSTLNRVHELAAVKVLPAISSAPLRNSEASAPTSPGRIHVIHPKPSTFSSSSITRASSPIIDRAVLPVYYSGVEHVMQFEEIDQLLAKKMLIENGNGDVGAASHPSVSDSVKLSEASLGPTELDKDPTGLSRDRFATTWAKRDPFFPPALCIEDHTEIDSSLETGESEPDGSNLYEGHQTFDYSEYYSLPLLRPNGHLSEFSASENTERSSSMETFEVLFQTCDEPKGEGSFQTSSPQDQHRNQGQRFTPFNLSQNTG